jgi:hypothetical protein
MHLPVPNLPPPTTPEPPALVRSAFREDVLWNRPIFKAPPLESFLQSFDATIFAAELRRVGLGER